MGYPGAGHHLAASLLLMEGFALGLREEPLVLLDSEGRLEALNHAASMAIGVSPAEYLGREAASLPAPWGEALSLVGQKSRRVRWTETPQGWMGELSPFEAIDEELLWEAIALAPSVSSALPLIAALYERVSMAKDCALYIRGEDGLVLASGSEESPKHLTAENSLALRLGRSARFDGSLLKPFEGWSWSVPAVSRVINFGSRVGIVHIGHKESSRLDGFLHRLYQSLIRLALV